MSARRPSPAAWVVTTVLGYALALGAATLVMGVPGRALSSLLGGLVYLAVYGAVVGIVVALVQLAALRGRSIAPVSWIATSALGLTVAFPVMAIVGEVLGNAIDPLLPVALGEGVIQDLSGATLGIILGIAQWRVLRPLLSGQVSWLIASAIGAGIGYGIAAAALELFEIEFLRANLVLSFGAMVGLLLGGAQAVALMRSGALVVEAR
ncbi:MAG TPA: hypothetical protein VIN70_09385 [Candidatus Limnocylindria bacterium]